MQDSAFSNQQSAYQIGRASQIDDIDRNVFEAMRFYVTEDLGLSDEFARSRAGQELQRKTAIAACNALSAAGVQVANVDTLDLGSGLGAMSEELVIRGACVTALEPGKAWANLTRRRVERHGGQFKLIEAFGESIPLPTASVDLVVSLQVLEHVRDPRQVLAEAWRVLRPGGHFYLACENYLAFREAHYLVPWLPLMPKSIGSLYLRAIGRSPQFLRESVTYTTYPGVLRHCRAIGFIRWRDEEMRQSLHAKQGLKWMVLRRLASLAGEGAPLWLDRARCTFKFGIYELFRKPKQGD